MIALVLKTIGAVILLFFGAIFAVGYFGSQSGLSDTDMATMKKSIRSEFEKQKEVQVSDVVMVRDGSHKATGYVKINLKGVGELMKTCDAQMDRDNKNYFWRCK